MKKRILIVISLIAILAVSGTVIHRLYSDRENSDSNIQTSVSDTSTTNKEDSEPTEQSQEALSIQSDESSKQEASESTSFDMESEDVIVELEEDEEFDIN